MTTIPGTNGSSTDRSEDRCMLPPSGHIKRAIRRALQYVDNAKAIRERPRPKPGLVELLYFFLPWWRSFQGQETLNHYALPWLTFPAVQFLKRSVRPHLRVFEFGSGASTIFFGLRCKEIYSIEHDITWAEKVKVSLRELGISNCRLRYVPPEAAQLAGDYTYRSHFPGYEHQSFEIYAKSIDEHPDGSLDLVLVDGRAREACIKHAIIKVRPGGMLILDNTERSRYNQAALEVPKAWNRLSFPGPSAGAEFFTETTVWIAPGLPDDRAIERCPAQTH